MKLFRQYEKSDATQVMEIPVAPNADMSEQRIERFRSLNVMICERIFFLDGCDLNPATDPSLQQLNLEADEVIAAQSLKV